MVFLRFLTIALLVAALGRSALAAAPDDDFLAAYDAYRAGDAIKLERHAARLRDYVLEPYLEYWDLGLRLEDADARDVEAFLGRHAGSYLAERLRDEWLRELGRRADWPAFDRAYTGTPEADRDLELRCDAWSSRLAQGDESAYAEAAGTMWLVPRELPQSCAELARAMVTAGRLGADQIWDRFRRLVEDGRLTAAKRALGFLPVGAGDDQRLLRLAESSPQRLLSHPPASLERRAAREVLRFAFVRLSRSDPRPAAEILKGPLGDRLSDAERASLWGRIAYDAARRHLPQALAWYALAADARLSDEQLAWKVRAALRAGDWAAVRDAINDMSRAALRNPAWTYWYARALAALGVADGAHAYYLTIAGEPDFYGVLAAEELGGGLAVPEPFHVPSEEEVGRVGREPGLVRALELYRLGLRPQATREWNFSIRGMDDRQLLAAAELARRAGVFDRAINTADRTRQLHNYRVRFLAPFRRVFSEQARTFDLEEAWVLGLVRQESRFISDARSSAGAQGLMQLMPSTARWIARKIGLRLRPHGVNAVDVNVALGTGYLKYVLDRLGNPLLASTAYNAGPGRARRWLDAKPLEGAIYVETIPFDETRDYVKKVMLNTMYYAALLGGARVSLKQRLGWIAGLPPDEQNEE